ncbi:MAG: preprotein translocase subunit YajC [Elusimicrobiota bacterium]|jgi:preprotein translocase subunit YajC|nr:preprotein translocase subunit YajC [Elusimicrobiota bacterium]
MFDLLYADATVTPKTGNPIIGFLPMILILVVFYFFLIRPQAKKAKEHQKMVSEIKKGDRVITNGGIYGIVDSFRTDEQNAVYIYIADDVKILILKDSIIKIIKS